MKLTETYLSLVKVGEMVSFQSLKDCGVDVDTEVIEIMETMSKFDYTLTKLPSWSYSGHCVNVDGLLYSHISFEKL